MGEVVVEVMERRRSSEEVGVRMRVRAFDMEVRIVASIPGVKG